jgi:hypothetical protein
MTGLVATETGASPFATRVVQPKLVSLEEAQRGAIKVYYSGLTKQTIIGALVGLLFLFIVGSNALGTEHKVAGAAVLAICLAGLVYLVYEYRRKPRTFILEDGFAVEQRFGFDVEVVRWSDIAKLYCLDRTTETTVRIYFLPVATSRTHRGKLKIVLVDGREIVITNRVREFSAMARQFSVRTMAAQLAPCTAFVIDGGTLDFDKFGLTQERLMHKGQLLTWGDIQRITLSNRGTLLFNTTRRWWSPRFSLDALPNASLLLELLGMFGGRVYEV